MKKLLLLFGLFLGFGSAAFAAADEGNVEDAMAEYNGREGSTGLTNYCNGSMSNQFYEQLLLRLASQIKGELVESYGALPQLYLSKVHLDYLDSVLATNKTIFGEKITNADKRGAFVKMLKIAINRVKVDSSLVPEPKVSVRREEIRRSSLDEVISLYQADTHISLFREKFRWLNKQDMVGFMYQAKLFQINPGNNDLKDFVRFSPLWLNEDFLGDIVLYAIENPGFDIDLTVSGVAVSLFDALGVIPLVKKVLNDSEDDFRSYLIQICSTGEKSGENIVKEIENYPVDFEDSDFKLILKNIAAYEQVEEKERRQREAESRKADHEYALRVANQQRYEELLHQGFTILSTMFRNGEAPITNSNDLIEKMNQIGDQFFKQGPPPPMHHHAPFSGFERYPSVA